MAFRARPQEMPRLGYQSKEEPPVRSPWSLQVSEVADTKSLDLAVGGEWGW